MVVVGEDGQRKFVHHPHELATVGRLRTVDRSPDDESGPTRSPLGIPMGDGFEAWWEANRRYSDALMDVVATRVRREQNIEAYQAALRRLEREKKSKRRPDAATRLFK